MRIGSIDLVANWTIPIGTTIANLLRTMISSLYFHRILKPGQGRMVISDLVRDKEVHGDSIDSDTHL
jgi:hypothetical protein